MTKLTNEPMANQADMNEAYTPPAEKRIQETKQEPEAVCFTAGPQGVPFGAGVIHSWLAADQDPPIVAAGISAGAFTAAAMQQAFRELKRELGGDLDQREARRWVWFRRYVRAVTVEPLDFLWRALPDPVDFGADLPPVADASVWRQEADEASPHSKESVRQFKRGELRARRHFDLLTKVGSWLAGLPIRVSSVASFAVYYVRWKERYGVRARNLFYLGRASVLIGLGFLWHIVRSPAFVLEWQYSPPRESPDNDIRLPARLPHPLFGWLVWLGALVVSASMVLDGIALMMGVIDRTAFERVFLEQWGMARLFATSLAILIVLAAGIAGSIFSKSIRSTLIDAITKYLLTQVDLSERILDPFELERKLCQLFEDRTVGDEPMHLLLVAADLREGSQFYYEPTDRLVEGLLASLAVPGLYPPVRPKGLSLELVDGAVVRQNPLPALFWWLREVRNDKGKALESDTRHSVYVIYSVPIEPREPKPDDEREPVDIVSAAYTSLELARRRDTRQEVRHTNFIADVARVLDPGAKPGKYLRISAAEIAPATDIKFANPWSPQPKEVLQAIASGCRATMERRFYEKIDALGIGLPVPCSKLLQIEAPGREIESETQFPGLLEVCAECTRVLECRPPSNPEAPPKGVKRSFGIANSSDLGPTKTQFAEHGFNHLQDDHPRIVFVASGGVFRGAFHIGSIGALHACNLKPDLVVGASVGSLMGGALSAISTLEETRARELLHELAAVFLHVDQRIAFTRTLKNAAKQLGIRMRRIELSPSEVRRMVRRGSRADAGYAAAGAPPALIDAISDVFLIPHTQTTGIAGHFVAGHIADAWYSFLKQVRAETLPGLEIKDALMGTSLLEQAARELLGERFDIPIDCMQPYLKREPPIAFFAMTSFLNRRIPLLLGRDFLTKAPAYEFVMAGLSSSAFPSVFSPRTASEVVPAFGSPDDYFADGGMFDNIPFLPAIEVLQAVQTSGRSGPLRDGDEPDDATIDKVVKFLKGRVKNRDLFIAAGLNADPGEAPPELDTIVKIYNRAGSLRVNLKIDAFRDHSNRAHELLAALVDQPLPEQIKKIPKERRVKALKFLDRAIDADIVKIVPTDQGHINGTFAFCRSTGMDAQVIKRSIADGCFRTLQELTRRVGSTGKFGDRALDLRESKGASGGGECGFYLKDGKPLRCPFADGANAEIVQIRSACIEDRTHRTRARAS